MASGVAESAATEVALGRISGAVPSGLGSWALRTTGAASGAFVMAFWPSELGDGTLYTDEQLRAMSRAITRVRFRFIEDEQGKMQVYGIHTSAASGMDSVPVIHARQEGSAVVAAVPGGPTLTWYPDSSGEIPDASTYYPDSSGMEVENIWVRPIPDAPDAELETFPVSSGELDDCIITFPASLGVPPLYLVFSKPPVKLLETDIYRGRFRIRKLKHVKRSDTQQLRGFAQAPHLWKPHFRDSRNSAVSAVQYESGFRESNMPYQHCRGSDSH